MHFIGGLRVWSVLILIGFSGWAEHSADAQLLRGRRQRCCCPASANRCCCETRDPPAMCVIDLAFSTGTWWYYYAHHHENGTECPEYGEVIYSSPVPRSPVPMSCLDNECLYPYSVSSVSSAGGLDSPIDVAEDLSTVMPTTRATRIDELAGDLTLPDNRKIHARIGVFKVTAPVEVDGVAQDVTEYFAFGLESADTGRQDFHAREVKEHLIGTTPQKNLYEFNIGSLKCVVLTVR